MLKDQQLMAKKLDIIGQAVAKLTVDQMENGQKDQMDQQFQQRGGHVPRSTFHQKPKESR